MVTGVGLRSERELLQRLGDHVLLAYWDKDLRCRFANRTYESWFGVSPEQLLESHITDYLRPLFERNRVHIEAALAGEPQRFQCEVPRVGGGPPRYCLTNYLPDVVDDTVRGFFVFTSDVTELEESQIAHAASDAWFARIIDLAGDALICVDEHRKICVFNACAEEMYGYRANEVIGRDAIMLGPERFREQYADAVDQFIHGTDASAVLRATVGLGRRNNGDEFPIEVTQSKFVLAGETLITFLVRDTTDRARAELQNRVLAETGAMLSVSLDYKETLQTIANLIVAHLADSCVIDIFSPGVTSFERLAVAHVDPEKAAVIEKISAMRKNPRSSLSHLVLETREPLVIDDIDEEMIGAYAENEEHYRAMLSVAYRSAMVVPLVIQGEAFGALVLGSERARRYSSADIPLATELARRASLAIHNARLYEAAQQATRARDEILEIVAHDLRAPLNSILLGAQILEGVDTHDPVAHQEIESIVRSTQWANRLIEDLIDVRRIDGGALAITPTTVSVREEIRAALPMHQSVASAAGISIRESVAADVHAVWADRDRLRQVLENLIGNAVKFTSAGGHISIGAINDGSFVRFTVSDTGTGIPEANLERVFDRFWQANRSERRGAGLGLPICKGIVEKHGGRIWATSAVGRGTTFHFTLPVANPMRSC